MSDSPSTPQTSAKWQQLKELCGHWQDGSCETVKLGWDDATRTAFLSVGKKGFYGTSLDDVLQQASKELLDGRD